MSSKRIVILGGSGRVGARLVNLLRAGGHEVVAASRATGADVVTGRGLARALAGDGEVLTENVAVLYWIARQARGLAPAGPLGPVRLLEALAFIATEVHKPLRPFFTPAAGPAERTRAAAAISRSLDLLAGSLAGPHLFGSRFTAADAYLFAMLGWTIRFGIAVPPPLVAFRKRAAERSHVRTALAEEGLPGPPALQRAG